MPQIVKKSVPEKKSAPAERLDKVNPISKAKYEAAMQKQWKSRPENQMKATPKEVPARKTPTAPKQMMQPSNKIDVGARAAIKKASSLRQEMAPKKSTKKY